MKMLKDTFGRTCPYIRLSITDVCNFKCGYCLPNGYQVDKSDNRKFLHLEEIRRLAKVFSKLGVNKIRLTGGEPTVRNDFFEIIKILKHEAGIKKVVITTNGYHLDKKAKMLVDSGINGINISIDSLDRNTFKNVTGHDRLPEILKGINILQDLNFENIKINAEEGDLLAVKTAGAYGFVMSSNYNARPRAPEILVDGSNHYLIRRRETLEDLIDLEEMPIA